MLIVFGSLVLLCLNSASAASTSSPNHIYVNGSSGNDLNDGLTPETAKLTIKNDTGTVSTGVTVSISGGTYSGAGNTNIKIDHDMTIIGAGKTKTTITGSGLSQIFIINDNVKFILKNMTLANGKSGYGGGILNQGHTTVDNCVFTECYTIYAYMGGGSAIANTYYSTLTISNTDFLYNDARASSSGGGTIYTNGTLNMNNCSFIGNTAYLGGCIFTSNGNINIANSSFINNTATVNGGVICSYSSDTNMNFSFCSFVGNTANHDTPPNNIYNPFNNYLNVNSCWWGTNNGPNGITGSYTANNWIYMTLNPDKTKIKYKNNTTVTANFNNLYDRNTKTFTPIDPAINHIPDGLIVNFSTDNGEITTPSITQNGEANATFTGTQLGQSIVTGTCGSMPVSSAVTVEPLSTITTVDDAKNYPGQNVTLTAHVKDENNNPVDGGYVTFTINGQNIKVQVVNGVATTSWTIPSSWAAGTFTINAYYNGTGTFYYGDSSATGNLNVQKTPTVISTINVECEYDDKIGVKAHLVDTYGNPVIGATVIFNIDNVELRGTTNSNGDATVYYTIKEVPGNYDIIITFPGNDLFGYSTCNADLEVYHRSTFITVPDVTGKHGDTVDLQAVLKDRLGNSISGKTIDFSVNGVKVGTGKTDGNGTAVFSYYINNGRGINNIVAYYSGNAYYGSNMGFGKLSVNPIITKITTKDTSGKHGDKTSLIATLKDENGNPLAEKTIKFIINGQTVGSALT